MIKAITAFAAATLIAAIFIVAPGAAPEVSANTPDQPGRQQVAAKSDRLSVHPIGPACSQRAWPYYDQDCTFEARWSGATRAVRLVTTDKLAQ